MRTPKPATSALVSWIGSRAFVTTGERRLRIAQALTENRERIVKQVWRSAVPKAPGHVVSPGGNAYGQELTATCLRDYGLLSTPSHLWHCGW